MTSFDNQLVIVAFYVDDLVIGCKEEAQVLKVKKLFAKNFPVTDKGLLHHYLGIDIERKGVNHSNIKDLLKEYGMENCKAIATLLEANHQASCSKGECELIDQHDYQQLLGRLCIWQLQRDQTYFIPYRNYRNGIQNVILNTCKRLNKFCIISVGTLI